MKKINKINDEKIDEFLAALAGLAGRGMARVGSNMLMAGGRMAATQVKAKMKRNNLLKTAAAKNVLKRSATGSKEAEGAATDARSAAFERINARRQEKGQTNMLNPAKKFKKGQAEGWKRSARFEALLQAVKEKLNG